MRVEGCCGCALILAACIALDAVAAFAIWSFFGWIL